jgi:enoyl-CoA hydratase/carnithine racemase
MSYTDYSAISVGVDAGVAHLTIDHPPVNLLDALLVGELQRFVKAVRDDDEVKVIVAQSADPEFFVAHLDMIAVLDPAWFAGLADGDPAPLNPMQALWEGFRNLPQVTIAKLAGRLRGGGVEFAMALDMRFAAAGHTWFSQLESRVGAFPGGGGTQYLPRLVGRARALEVILGGDLFDSDTAERYGWINRAMPPEELDAFIDDLARRIAVLPPGVVAAVKVAVDEAVEQKRIPDGLVVEGAQVGKIYPAPEWVVERARARLDAGMQSRESELDLEAKMDLIP